MSIERFIANLPLRRKLMLIVMFIVMVATGTIWLFLREEAARARSDQFVQHALAQAHLVAEYAVSPLVFDDDKGAQELLSKFALDARVQYVRIDDLRGEPFAEVNTGKASVPQVTPTGPHVWSMERDVLHVAAPVMQAGKSLGILRVGFKLDDLQQTLVQEQRFLLLVLAGVVALSYLLTFLLQRLITAPLLELQKHANRLADSQEFTTLKPPGRDEVGSLYRAFNHLILCIQQRESDILALNRSLEAKVAERTRDLEIARDKADLASRSKSEFLANMSHEIRTPINAITGFTTLALRSGLNARQTGYLERIQTAAQGLLGIINDLLDFSKIEAGRLDMERISFRLAEVMETMVASIGNQAESKGLELLIRVAPDVPPDLVGDPLRLSQVLINLGNNAIKFTEHGEVEVRVALKELGEDWTWLQFSVRDTGIGLTPEQSGKLFQAFTQADTSTTRRFGGTGLGLAICQRLVSMMNGRIWLDSRPGQGTTFYFEAQLGVKRARETFKPGAAYAVPLLPAELRGKPALVVDDNANARQILAAQLSAFGMDAQTADNGEAALQELRRASAAGRPYPLVLMDWKMPGLDGIAATRAIRADPSIAGTPVVIMVTAYGREQTIGSPENAALFESVLLKPVTPELLAETLCRSLEPGAAALQDLGPRALRLPGVRLLLVEDNPVNQQLAQELLELEGAQVRIAGNGRVALDILEDAAPDEFDAVLLDVQMPEMDGYEAARRIRQLPGYAGFPLIAMTAHAMVEERERCLAAGMNDHIAKPIDPELLVGTLMRWIGPDRLACAEQRPAGNLRKAASATPSCLSDASLPELPGIDIEAGLKRCMGNARLYRDVLVEFHRRQADSAAQIGELCKSGKFAEAGFAVHRLKGAAANLELREVTAVVVQIEQVLLGARHDELPSLLERLAESLAVVHSGLAALTPSAAPAPEEPESGRHFSDEVRKLAATLADCLRDQDTQAESVLAGLRAALVQAAGREPQWIVALAATIDALDYDAALAILRGAGLD